MRTSDSNQIATESTNSQDADLSNPPQKIKTQEEVEEWYAKKISKEVSELDDYDLHCTFVAHQFYLQHLWESKKI